MRKPTQARRGSEDNILAPRWAISAVLHRNPEIISRHCRPLACDVRSRALLYDVDEAERTLADLARWPASRRTTSATCKRD